MNRPEQELQIQVANFLRYAMPPTVFWFAPNPGIARKKGARVGKIQKNMGVKAGVPDLVFMRGMKPFGIELKAPRGTLNAAQKEVHIELIDADVPVYVATSLDQVEFILRDLGIPLKATAGDLRCPA